MRWMRRPADINNNRYQVRYRIRKRRLGGGGLEN